MSTSTTVAPLRSPRSARCSAALGIGGIIAQILAIGLINLARGQERYGLATALVTAGILCGVGALVCGGSWCWRLHRRIRTQRLAAQRSHSPRPDAARRSERGLVLIGMLTGVVATTWLIATMALGLGHLLVAA